MRVSIAPEAALRGDGLRTKLFLTAFVVSFFGPYFPGTPLRLDQLVCWGAIVCFLFLLVVRRKRYVCTKGQAIAFYFSLAVLVYSGCRILIGIRSPIDAAQMANQFSYFAGGVALFYLFKDRFVEGQGFFVQAFLSVSLAINLFAALQFFFLDSEMVKIALRLYGGMSRPGYEYENFSTLAAVTLLGGRQAVSIFSGAQGLAIFNLMVVAVAHGGIASVRQNTWRSMRLPLAALLAAIVGGVLSGSKTFIFGSIFYFVLSAKASQYSLSQVRLLIALVIFFFGTFFFIAAESRVTGDVFALISEGDIFRIFNSRFGDGGGYLNDVMAKTFEVPVLAFGLGTEAFDYKYTDFEYRQIILAGGLPLFVAFYGFLIHLLVNNFKARKHAPFGAPLLALGVVYLIAGVGQDVHLQARTMPLWVIVNLLFGMPCNNGKNLIDATSD